jgi:hypothetical protein
MEERINGLEKLYQDENRDEWFEECNSRDIPFAFIRKRRKYAHISIDGISTDRSIDKPRLVMTNEAMLECKEFLEEVFHEQSQKSRNNKTIKYSYPSGLDNGDDVGGGFILSIDNVLIEDCERVMEELCEIVFDSDNWREVEFEVGE